MSNFGYDDVITSKQEKLMNPKNYTNVNIKRLLPNDNNLYEISDIDELADSIETHGILQPLLVKQVGEKQYLIIAGHRRYAAMKKLIEEDRTMSELVPIRISDEEDLMMRIQLHETNTTTRSLLKQSEEVKLAIIEDYMDILEQAREQGITVNGKEIKGKTKDLIAEKFGISARTANDLIVKVKLGGAKLHPLPKKEVSTVDKLNKVLKQLQKIDIDYEDLDQQEILNEIRLITTFELSKDGNIL